MELLKKTALEQGEAIKRKEISPLELLDAAYQAIDAHPFAGRIFARLTKERAFDEAKAAEERQMAGVRFGLLDGVPLSWKDLFDTSGGATEAGSKRLLGRVPREDAAVLQAASQGGAVCVGKTHMTELAFSGLGLNPMTESPPNIHDPDCVAGGSSSGAAASVAFGFVAAGIGSDTGGSVRVPAAWNNLVGLKTTAGKLSLAGVVPLCPKFDTVGPLCKSVADSAALYHLLGGEAAQTTPKGQRYHFAVLETVALEGLDPIQSREFEAAVARLKTEGHKVTVIKSPTVSSAMALAGVIYTVEAYAIWQDTLEAAPEEVYPPVLERFRAGQTHSGLDYYRAWQNLNALRAEFDAEISKYDGVLMPSVASLPPFIQDVENDSKRFTSENLLALRNTRITNLMGGCAITLPNAAPYCGVSLSRAGNSEARLLEIAGEIEAAILG